LKTEQSTAGRSLRGVSIVITLLSVVIFATIAYSAYEDSVGILGIFGQGSSTPAVTAMTVYHGSTAIVSLNITLHNNGLYPLAFSISCVQSPGALNATCNNPATTIAMSQTATVHFLMNVTGVSPQSGTGGRPIDADVNVTLGPFVSLKVTTNLSGLVGVVS